MAYREMPSTENLSRPAGSGSVSLGVQRRIGKSVTASENVPFEQVARILLLHAPLMLIFYSWSMVATIHSILVVLLGLNFILNDKSPTRAAFVVGYLAGAEILWRGASDAALVSEYGKFATIFLCALMIAKYRLMGRHILWPVLFLALLLPGVFIMPAFDRQALSYQLAGPVALCFVSMTFGALEFKKTDIQKLFLWTIAPVVSMGFFVLYNLFTQDVAFYSGGENEILTGGIGANQVASALSLGATLAFFYIFLVGKDSRLRNLMIVLALGLIVLSVLTFSRGGFWNALGAIAAGLYFLFRNRREMARTFGILIALGLLGYYVIFPFLENLTGGAVTLRFSSFDTTGRDVLFRIDYDLFLKNPVLGVGVGQSPLYHVATFGYPKPTHTEYSRLLAEHGGFGVAIIAILALVVISRIFSRRDPVSKGISVGLCVWTLLYFTHSATRMVAPSFTFGVAAAQFDLEEEENNEGDSPAHPNHRRR
ncbi:MAG: O-antigen ligase family protein [Chloroflexota bacterium]